MMILYGLDLCTTLLPLLTPRWQQGVDTSEATAQEIGSST